MHRETKNNNLNQFYIMNAQLAESRVAYDIIRTSELTNYMTLDEMHERLTTNIRKAFEK